MKLKFAKGLTITATQKARLQRFEDRLEALSKKEDQLVVESDRVSNEYMTVLDNLGLTQRFTGKSLNSLTVVPLGED